MTVLTNEQFEKMKQRWVAAKGAYDLGYEMVDETRKTELESFEREQRAVWTREKILAEHVPEIVHKTGDDRKGKSISRIPTAHGHIYFQTVWIGDSVSSSMCFVPGRENAVERSLLE